MSLQLWSYVAFPWLKALAGKFFFCFGRAMPKQKWLLQKQILLYLVVLFAFTVVHSFGRSYDCYGNGAASFFEAVAWFLALKLGQTFALSDFFLF